MTTRIGVLTAGGDAPGLNAAIRAVVRTAIGAHGFEVLGFRKGWRGVMDGDVLELTSSSVEGILHRGGTILGSSGADPYHDQGVERVRRTFVDLGVDALVTNGGEGTMGAAAHMSSEGVPVVGIPKTIDNDLPGTDACIGFATAVQVATEAIDRLHTTAESHDAAATDLIARGGFGQMVALQGDRIGEVPLAEAAKVRPVPEELELFFEKRRCP